MLILRRPGKSTTDHILCVEISNYGVDNKGQSQNGELESSAEERGKAGEVGWAAEDITVHLLPAILVTKITLLGHTRA